ncbi:response regulator [Chloroflexota bacterium]
MKEKILIVEDNPQNMRLIEMTLAARGYTLLKAIDGREALDIAVREYPSLILMDIQLPKLSGLEVTRRLREMPEFRDIPIIAVTAYAMEGDKHKFIMAGCDAYLSKPVSPRELLEVIIEMLSKHEKSNI